MAIGMTWLSLDASNNLPRAVPAVLESGGRQTGYYPRRNHTKTDKRNFPKPYENISFTFSKNDLSPFLGSGLKLSSVLLFSKNFFWSRVKVCGVHTLT